MTHGEFEYDVFLSHNSRDKPAVRALAALLEERGVRVWLDEDQLVPGHPWQPALETAIKQSKTGAVLIGQDGLGPWHDREMQVLLNDAARQDKPVIPVLLPGAADQPELPAFLELNTYVDLRSGFCEEALQQLVWGITGVKPEDQSRPPRAAEMQIATTRLRHAAETLVGRAAELARLDAAWADPKTRVVVIRAWGGVGKTALVVDWMARLAEDGYRGAARVFDWSFYSQGTREQGAASADVFVDAALRFFGDDDPTAGSPWDKGDRLARLVSQEKTLLVLDGLEPLQYPPGPLGGQLKDPTIESLLKRLAQQNSGLCLVTTRERVTDLVAFHEKTAAEWKLEHLSEEAGAKVLHQTGVEGPEEELRHTSREVQGHALTLQLLGRYLARAHRGDVRRRDRVRFAKADAEVQGGHAFKVMATYEKWLASGGKPGWWQGVVRWLMRLFGRPPDAKYVAGRRQLAMLNLIGLFDRPADPACLAALRAEPVIPGLTDPLVDLSDEDWNLTIAALEEAGLVTPLKYEPRRVKGFSEEVARREFASSLGEPEEFEPPWARVFAGDARALEAHPLLREHFANRLRETNDAAWQEAHRRLYKHLGASVPYWPEGMDGLQPLYQAVAHGCQAGRHEDALASVYDDRINRGTGAGGFYSSSKLGAIGADLGAVACFFEEPWKRLAPSLSEPAQAWLLGVAAFNLRALGRLTEALDPMRVSREMYVSQSAWREAAIVAGNVSELELTLSDVGAPVQDAEQAVEFADRSKDAFQRIVNRARLADALHQAGRRAEAAERFREAEAMQAERQPEYPLLYSQPGFLYCDLLLAEAERGAWQVELSRSRSPSGTRSASVSPETGPARRAGPTCREVEQRATKTLGWASSHEFLLDIALDHLTLGRAALYRAVLNPAGSERDEALATARGQLDDAVNGLRASGQLDDLPRGLLSRAWLCFVEGDADAARCDLDEAWGIAERGPMRLHMADVLLTRARLFCDRAALDEARELIDRCGYHRRDDELADAEAAARDWA